MNSYRLSFALVIAAGLAVPASADILTVGSSTVYRNTFGNGDINGAGVNATGSRADWTAALGNSVAFADGSSASGTPGTGIGNTSGSVHFTSGVTASISVIGSPADGGFFVGEINGNINNPLGLNNGYFDAGDAARPTNNPIGLGFGNSDFYHANGLRIDFNPGVSAFGFNFDDVGDVGAVLIVSWSDGTTQNITLGAADNNPNADQDGFFGLIRGGASLTSMTLLQSPGSANDGFSLYNLTVAPAVVPLPPAVAAGAAGLAGVFYLGRRRNKAAKSI